MFLLLSILRRWETASKEVVELRERPAVPADGAGVPGGLGSGPTKMWVLPSDLTAVIQARRHVVGACGGIPTEKVDIARLLVTELVSNAVRHGSGTVVLAVAREGGGVRVEVHDESPDMPVVLEPESLLEHGAGLRLVAALASRWGAASRDGHIGKWVWFVLD